MTDPEAARPVSDPETWRLAAWEACPHDGKYGDDGEMQCRGADFRRGDPETLFAHLLAARPVSGLEDSPEPFWNRRWTVFEDEDGRFCVVTEDDAAEYVVWPEMAERDVQRVVDAHNTTLNAIAALSESGQEEPDR